MPNITLKEAAGRALAFVEDTYRNQIADVLLEEIKLSDDTGDWLVTVGFSLPSQLSPAFRAAGHAAPRSYKVIRIDGRSGEVKDLLMRGA